MTGCLGLVWVVLWLLFYNSPAKHPALSNEEREYIPAGQEKHLDGTGRPTIGSILSPRNFWGIALQRFLGDPTWGTLTFWLPLYLTTVRHFDLNTSPRSCGSARFGFRLQVWRRARPLVQKYFDLSLINARRGALTFVGVCCQDLAGTCHPADFDWFGCEEREFSA